MVIWYIFSRFGMLHQEKSGNHDWDPFVYSITLMRKLTQIFFLIQKTG
jgi:hypothetical protein